MKDKYLVSKYKLSNGLSKIYFIKYLNSNSSVVWHRLIPWEKLLNSIIKQAIDDLHMINV